MDFTKNELYDLFIKLYTDNIVLAARVDLLQDMFIGYVKGKNKPEGDALNKFLDDNFGKYKEARVLDSKMKDDFLELKSQEFLQKMRDQLGLGPDEI